MAELGDLVSSWFDAQLLSQLVVASSGRLLAEARIARIPVAEVAVQASVTIAVRAWVASADYGAVRSELLERIKRALDKYGLSIPAEQRALPAVTLTASK
jgi:small-conductance mechanosensitive channel